MKVIVDTGAFCALAIPHDQNNPKAKPIHEKLIERKAILYTSDYVLDETYTLLKMRGSHATAVKFMDRIQDTRINVLRITEDIETAAKTMFRKFDDRKLSFTDCTSFAVINHLDLRAVFAFDEHFRYHPYSHPVEFLG